jgi:hypothetical protein
VELFELFSGEDQLGPLPTKSWSNILSKSSIERSDAISIAAKIGAEVEKSGKHARATLRVKGLLVLTFGIRHGPKSGHGHLCGSNAN